MEWSLASNAAKLIAVSSPAADAFSPDSVCRDDGPDGPGGSGTAGGTVDGLMQSKDPESVAVAFRLVLAHLTQTSKRLQMADVIQSVEQQGATAYEAVSHQWLQGAAES